jgi:hypothetical protein
MSNVVNDPLIQSQIPIAAFLIAASLGLSVPARAAENPVNMQIVRYDNLPASPKFSVEAAENTELDSNAQAGLKEALERHRIDYGQSAHLVMIIAAEKIGSNPNPPPATNFEEGTGKLHISIGSTEPSNYAQVRHQYRISLDLYDRLSGRYLWRGQITDAQPDADPFVATKPMIEQLVNALVSERPSAKCPINQTCSLDPLEEK